MMSFAAGPRPHIRHTVVERGSFDSASAPVQRKTLPQTRSASKDAANGKQPSPREISLIPNRPSTSPPPYGAATQLAPLDKHYHQLELHATAQHWKIFSARSTFGNKEASVFLFEKKNNVKAPPRLGRINRLALSDLIKYDLTQLTSLQHPRILHVQHGLEETKEYMAFASEAVHASLDNIVIDEGLDKLEMKLGVLQLIDGLSYLHNSAKILHGNLTPSSVYVTNARLWKIAGFSFSVAAKEPNTYPCFPWTKKLPPSLQPDLDFLAPEYLAPNQHTVTSAADVFSLGVLICWIYAGGKRLIDAKNNLETHAIVCGQLSEALSCIGDELGSNLKESLNKVLSMEVVVRPSVQLLALIKHFDDPCVSALRQLDDLGQEFDPTNKAHFLAQGLFQTLPQIPEPLWFSRVLPRLTEQLYDSHELYAAVAKPLFLMLEHCESHNIHRLQLWMRRLMEHTNQKSLRSFILDNMSVLFRRLSDEKVEDKLLDLIVHSLTSDDASMQSSAIRGVPAVADFLPVQYIIKRLLPAVQTLPPYLNENVPRQLDLLAALANLSDRCDHVSLTHLCAAVSICNSTHPVIIHAKSRLVQRIVTKDGARLRNPSEICLHLLNPLVLGIANKDLSPAHFDDVMSSIRILLDIVEQLRYENEERDHQHVVGGLGRLGNRRVSMSSTNLPRVMISAARPSFSNDNRKMSFLSADGRLEDRGSRRESKESRGSLESDVSIRIAGWGTTADELSNRKERRWRIGNGSDASDESCQSQRGRRQSWLENYMHSCSLEQGSTTSSMETKNVDRTMRPGSSLEARRPNEAMRRRRYVQQPRYRPEHSHRFFEFSPLLRIKRSMERSSERRSRTRSPTQDLLGDGRHSAVPPARPSSFSNLGHNLVLTYRNFWQKE